MAVSERAWSTSTPPRVTAAVVAAAVVAVAAITWSLAGRPVAPSTDDRRALPSATVGTAPSLPDRLPRDRQRGLGAADGVVPDGVTVFDDRYPAVALLDPALLGALRRAATDAARAGVTLYVDSGWRSPRYQEQLLREAIAKYGSEAEAARWVATPGTSAHVSGDAVDIGHADATAWLSRFGAGHGLCRIYRNEPWHFELRPGAAAHGCPAMYADAARDPRLRR